jgi:predicted transcriptional regulator of viral defense system
MKLASLKYKLFFTVHDVAAATGTSLASAHVLCSRYVKNGIFVRIKKNFYVVADTWDRYGFLDFLKIANFLQVPSYISFTTALEFYGLTTQIQRNWYESVATRRTNSFQTRGVNFIYHKFACRLYFGYERKDEVFIALPEKAVLDCAYLEVLGLGATDWDALSLDKMDRFRIKQWIEPFPKQCKQKISEKCRI